MCPGKRHGRYLCFIIQFLFSGQEAEITQIAAVTMDGTTSFSEYILPTCPIMKRMETITGLSVQRKGGKRVLCRNVKGTSEFQPVPSVSLVECLKHFVTWLGKVKENCGKDLVLVAHNARAFDMRHLLRHFQLTNMLDQFCTVVTSFGDSLPYLKDVFKGRSPDFKQSNLYFWLFGESYDVHDAAADVLALQRILTHSLGLHADALFSTHCFTVSSALTLLKWEEGMKRCTETLTPMFSGKNKIISKTMAQKIGGSGLTYRHLQCVHQRSGDEGIINLLAGKHEGKVRVTGRTNVLNAICSYLSAHSKPKWWWWWCICHLGELCYTWQGSWIPW